MATQSHYTADTHPLIRKLGSVFALSDHEQEALVKLPLQITKIRADQNIAGRRPPVPVLRYPGGHRLHDQSHWGW